MSFWCSKVLNLCAAYLLPMVVADSLPISTFAMVSTRWSDFFLEVLQVVVYNVKDSYIASIPGIMCLGIHKSLCIHTVRCITILCGASKLNSISCCPFLLMSGSNLSYSNSWLCILSPNNQLLLEFYSTGISAWSHSNGLESEVFAGWTYTTTLWPNQWWSGSYSLQLNTNTSAFFSQNCHWVELYCQVTWHLWTLSQAPASSSWIKALLLI